MKTIIAGSRGLTDPSLVPAAVSECGWTVSHLISGAAQGIDTLGADWAKSKGIPLTFYRADWERLGRSAGPLRNIQMAENAEALIAIWDGKSRGTRHMIEEATRRGLRVFVKTIPPVSR